MPKSFYWASNRLNNLPEMHFKFPFNLTGKSTMAFLTGQSWCILKSWYTGVGGGGGGREQGFWHYFANGLNQSLVSSVYDNITVDNTSPKLGSLDLWPAFFTLNSILTKKANNKFLDWYSHIKILKNTWKLRPRVKDPIFLTVNPI